MIKYVAVVGFEGLYEISELCDVFAIKTGVSRLLKKQTDSDGYTYVLLSKKSKKKLCHHHRLMAIAFIPNPENKEQVNHLNGIKHDNRLENLEWCTQSENQLHRYSVLSHLTPNRALTKEQVFDLLKPKTSKDIDSLTAQYLITRKALLNIRIGMSYKREYSEFCTIHGKPIPIKKMPNRLRQQDGNPVTYSVEQQVEMGFIKLK